jgi:aspartate aminotransferase-like enzyme
MPEGVDGQKVRADMESAHQVVVMGGQDRLKGKIIRIGHMGAISNTDLANTIRALAASIEKLKPGTIPPAKVEAAVTRATEILQAVPALGRLGKT